METEKQASKTILIAEADRSDGDDIGRSLATLPLSIAHATSVEAAMKSVASNRPEVVVADVKLPDASGFSLCRRIREDVDTNGLPVVLVSEWNSEMDRILAFECGADDFVPRPYFARELASRVEAILRRRRAALRDRPYESDLAQHARVEFSADPGPASALVVRVEGEHVDLTPKEQAILTALIDRDGRVCTRHELVSEIWRDEVAPAPRTIDSHVKTLRRKLGVAGDCLVTVRGTGYLYRPHPALRVEAPAGEPLAAAAYEPR